MTATPTTRRGTAAGLVTSAHPGPAVAVATIAALLAADAGLPAGTAVVVTAAVFTGHLTIGWVNDLVDAPRDRASGRTDKPLATGRVGAGPVAAAVAVAGLACVVLSFAAGWRSGVVHLLLGIGSGQAYNLGLKRTALSWLPYAVTFGTLPAVASLARDAPAWPPWWMLAAGAALGVGAHVVNALPDLADDLRTGVRGLPHRLGEPTARPLAAGLLVAASLVAALGPAGTPPAWVWVVLVVVGALAAFTLAGHGRGPFRAAIAIALLDVVLLVAAG
ncbi:UbiA family prenyltransferase [Actinomycetospora cinnamomea]|uniref:4-hydroxybenzoate polyprenyltransferase n=1 Tax=Actinomycetospora cinnamomea TaxID=663609 RepID=A0A2U1FRL6_9PSEU|nr:UbiA family prenyltransferase [Actinomycetospora cinnamomea]PVZ14806.1 4-hydroxybenzoate polyprenyltransferase [Actinomycetospora cinnamomea]